MRLHEQFFPRLKSRGPIEAVLYPTFGRCKLARVPSDVNPPPPTAYAPESRPTKNPEKSPWRKTPSPRLPADLLLIPWPKKLLDRSRRIDHAQTTVVDTRSRPSPQPDSAACAARLRQLIGNSIDDSRSPAGRRKGSRSLSARNAQRGPCSELGTPCSMLHASSLPPRSAWCPSTLGFEKSPTWAPQPPLPIVARTASSRASSRGLQAFGVRPELTTLVFASVAFVRGSQ